MKRNILSIMAVLALLTPAALNAQRRLQPIPETVQEISIEGRQKLRIVAGDETRLETTSDKNSIGTMRGQGTKMVVNSSGADVTLCLAPWRSIRLHAEDYATLEFSGSFDKRENLTVETEDYAQATFLGDTTDTVRTVTLILRAEDFSRITSNVILQHYNYELAPADFSCIVLAGLDQMHIENAGNRSHSIVLSDHGKFYRGRCTDGGEVYATEYPEDDDLASRVQVKATDRAVVTARDIAAGKDSRPKKKNTWDSGDFKLRFAWGWHNWGAQPFSGFGGVQGPAELTTTMNNLQLEGNIAIAENRWFSVSAGLGLEWNSFCFAESEMLWDATAEPYHLSAGADPNCLSRLKTRYVTLPVRMHFGDRDGWHIELTALPGLVWTGKNSGLRREYGGGNGQSKEKDFSVNRSINPYKFDVRAAVMYDWIGLYVQVSTLSVFRNNCDELFPIKFGIII